jgi:microcystin-dependent protein
MSEPFVAEIRIFAGNFAPRGWAFCNGQLIQVAQNTALFSLVGTTYGGDGRTTFGLPDMQGRAPMHPGRGPGLTPRSLGQKTGTSTVTLTQGNMPSHSHTVSGTVVPSDQTEGSGSTIPGRSIGANSYSTVASGLTPMASAALTTEGGSTAHNNLQPLLVLNYIIALVGLYPTRS